jgi:superoxide reductase
MTTRYQTYKCKVCGNIVEVVHGSSGRLTCCSQPMTLQQENTVDAATEKHVPVAALEEGSLKVTVGSVAHPMEDKHFIEWVEVIDGDKLFRCHLSPGGEPAAVFPVASDQVEVRAYCNLHGLWKR